MSVTSETREEHRLILLGYLLQSLTVLFGVTAIIGALINHVRYRSVRTPIYRSHCRWQLVTFWVAFTLVMLSLVFWSTPVLLLAGLWLYYRALRGGIAFYRAQDAPRF